MEEEAVEELGWLEQADEGKWKIQGDVEVIQHVSCDPFRAKPCRCLTTRRCIKV
jgi:hypothetical protein